jgi:hypothetical protein
MILSVTIPDNAHALSQESSDDIDPHIDDGWRPVCDKRLMKFVARGVEYYDHQRENSPTPHLQTRGANSERAKKQHPKHKILRHVCQLSNDAMNQKELVRRCRREQEMDEGSNDQ